MTIDVTIPLYTDLAQARERLLTQRGRGDLELPLSVRERVRRVFGADLTPDEIASRIMTDVRQRGDEALRDYTARIDGVRLDDLEVREVEMDQARASVSAEWAPARLPWARE